MPAASPASTVTPNVTPEQIRALARRIDPPIPGVEYEEPRPGSSAWVEAERRLRNPAPATPAPATPAPTQISEPLTDAAFDPEADPRGPIVEVGNLVEPDARFDLDRLIVADDVKAQLQMGVDLIANRDALSDEWGFDEICPLRGRCIMNLHGPAGTGKTKAVYSIARAIGKKVYQVDYAAIISKWIGDTPKHIVQAFRAAAHHEALLFWDEADSMMSKRISMENTGTSNSINQNRNVLMQELDRFNGIVITATNFLVNFDEAIQSRIAQHVQFSLPNRAMRVRLFDQHIPALAKRKLAEDVDLEKIAIASQGFSGRDILTVCENAIKRAFMESRDRGTPGVLRQEHFLIEIGALINSRNAARGHGQRRPAPRGPTSGTGPAAVVPAVRGVDNSREDHPTV